MHAAGSVRRVASCAVVVALLAGLTGCSFIADTLQRKTTPAENHKYQRITAVNTKKYWPNIDVITFVEEGSFLGSGTWSANAVVTIDGKDYRQILGPYSGGGEDLPLPVAGQPSSSLTVNYSDGSSEVIG
ncbi:hypothetical protein [Leifsonia sp. C5G2]|uniref:hypothetical protein n=1 Tax=Leifsonia sp. C5G2 TaxID=2735269 RepID=UPI0015857FCB|nr:hypothetical protein [Leifsonia sp. C5G2]NUU07449.1 hypothetical protein [Leifsonia sp. C5G2]